MAEFHHTRRRTLLLSAAGAGLMLPTAAGFTAEPARQPSTNGAGKEKDVGAVEDLMREHGVLRRALLVYIETVPKLRANPASIPADALARTAKLFRAFGEDYHERRLEEPYIFPAVKKAGGQAAGYIDVLKAQHDRGREVTDYILAVTGKGALSTDAEPLARAFESFVLMYQNHTAREDTIVFPAWKNVSPRASLTSWATSSRTSSTSNSARTASRTRSPKSGKLNRRSGLPTWRSSPLRRRRRYNDGWEHLWAETTAASVALFESARLRPAAISLAA
jgi:hemerythrin-like domain-containing protein